MAREIMQGDVEDLLRQACRVKPHPILADDPRLNALGAQLATMLLTTCQAQRNEKAKP